MTVDFNVYTGSEVGILKGVNLNQKAVISKNFNLNKNADRGKEIISLSWAEDGNFDAITVATKDQTVSTFDTTTHSTKSSRKFNFGHGALVSCFHIQSSTVLGLQSGEVGFYNGHSCSTIKTVTGKEHSDTIQKKPDLMTVKPNKAVRSQVATGGVENDVAIWDILRPDKPYFKAKNVKPDMLSLRVPVAVRDVAFLPQSSCVAACSMYKTVRLYDPRAQNRPVVDFEWEESPLTAVTNVPFSHSQIVVGSSYGRMGLFDLRKPNAKGIKCPLGVYKGIVGAVKDIAIHPTLPLIFSVSLDRFIRVHHLEDRTMIYKHYLSSRQNSVLVRSDLSESDFKLDSEDRREFLDIKIEPSEVKQVKRKKVKYFNKEGRSPKKSKNK